MSTLDTQTRHRYDVCLTPDQHGRLWCADKEWIGSEHYMGLAYFWHYGFRFDLRDATPTQRCRVHDRFLSLGLNVDGFSPDHILAVAEILGTCHARKET